METVLDIGSVVREILKGIGTITESIRTSYENVLHMKDTMGARRDMKRLERVSDAFTQLIFEPEGIRDQLHRYIENPKSKPAKNNLVSALNRSHELYQEAIKSLNLSVAFKARHPELADLLGTYLKQKGRLISGMGDHVRWRGTDAERAELNQLEPLFDAVNVGINTIRTEIKAALAEFDRRGAQGKEPSSGKHHDSSEESDADDAE